ncbi:hypothetical protein EV217_2578 [Phyllobacterium myrsinacearum]|nr:hypothetical protein EV217_2578 [Phyllobacterium myrsinacearum]
MTERLENTSNHGPDGADEHSAAPKRRHMRIFGRHVPIPQSVAMRRTLGGALVAGGTLGFLPILGFWMIPLGLVVLSHDSALVRRKRRQLEVKFGRRWKGSRAAASSKA